MTDDEEELGPVIYELFQDASEPMYEAILEEMDERLENCRSEIGGFEN